MSQFLRIVGVALAMIVMAGCSPEAPKAPAPKPEAVVAAVPPAPPTGLDARLASAKASSSASTRAAAEVIAKYASAEEKAKFATEADYRLSPDLYAHYQALMGVKSPKLEQGCHVHCFINPCGAHFVEGENCGIVECPEVCTCSKPGDAC